MKKFEDFKATITPEVLLSMEDEVRDNLNQHLAEDPIENSIEEIVWFNQSFSVSFTIRLIEKYHNWLHED